MDTKPNAKRKPVAVSEPDTITVDIDNAKPFTDDKPVSFYDDNAVRFPVTYTELDGVSIHEPSSHLLSYTVGLLGAVLFSYIVSHSFYLTVSIGIAYTFGFAVRDTYR